MDTRLTNRFERNVDAHFDQSEELAKHRRGVCAALSMQWLARKLTERQSSRDRIQALKGEENMGKASELQDRLMQTKKDAEKLIKETRRKLGKPAQYIDDKESGQVRLRTYGGAGQGLGIGKGKLVSKWGYAVDAAMAGEIRQHLQEGLVMPHDFEVKINDQVQPGLAEAAGLSGHVVAWYVSGGFRGKGWFGQHAYLFDPNLGEYRFRKSEIDRFVSDYLAYVRQKNEGYVRKKNERGVRKSQKVTISLKSFCLIAFDKQF